MGNLAMQSGFNVMRWVRVALMGCALGVIFAFVGASLRMLPAFGGKRVEPPLALSEDSREAELIRVIDSQLSALRGNDYTKAFYYADSSFKAQMNVRGFERMVKAGYPALVRSRSAVYGVIMDNGEQAVVNVGIKTASGRTLHYQYLLRKEKNGWKISGVTQVKLEGMVV